MKLLILSNKTSLGLFEEASELVDLKSIDVQIATSLVEFMLYYFHNGIPDIIYINCYSVHAYIGILVGKFLFSKIYYHIHDPVPFAPFIKKYFIVFVHLLASRLSFRVVVYGRLLKKYTQSSLFLNSEKIIWAYPPLRHFHDQIKYINNKKENKFVQIGRPKGYKLLPPYSKYFYTFTHAKYLSDADLCSLLQSSEYCCFNYSQISMMSAMPASVIQFQSIPLFFSDSFIREPFANKLDVRNTIKAYSTGNLDLLLEYKQKLSFRLHIYEKNSLKKIFIEIISKEIKGSD